MLFLSGICIIVLLILYFFYNNIAGAVTHYSYDIVDEHRFTLRSDTNFFSLFSKNSKGLPEDIVLELQASDRLEKVQSFSLVEVPVLAKFSLFTFGLETDIPVFSVTDSALTGSNTPIGISRSMLDFYNVQFAGTAIVFPKISETFILGQTVKITFGASKIFPSLPRVAEPIVGNIVRVGEDFPGFGIIMPESMVKQKMKEVGYTLAPPYKIVAYMKDMNDQEMVRQRYASYNLEFDIDSIHKLQEKMFFVRNIFLGISFFIASILGIFFVFLLFSFFRERREVFHIVFIFGLSGIRARILTLAEPIFLLVFGTIAGAVGGYFIIDGLIQFGMRELLIRGISYRLIPTPIVEISLITLSVTVFFATVITMLEYFWRKKTIMR